jgi:hypothetical protein
MLNRRTFTTGIAAAAVAGAAQALEVDEDHAVRDILRQRVEVGRIGWYGLSSCAAA